MRDALSTTSTPSMEEVTQRAAIKEKVHVTKTPVKEEKLEKSLRIAGEFEVIDSYDGVEIIKTKEEVTPIYTVLMPELSEEDWATIKEIKEMVLTESTLDPSTIKDPEERKRVFTKEVMSIIKGHKYSLPKDKMEIFSDMIAKSMIGYGLLDPLLKDDQLEELMVIGVDKRVYVAHRKYGMCSTNIVFRSDEEVINIIDRMARYVGRKIDIMTPLLDARLPDGSRINATIPPVTPEGSTLTIRKFREDALTIVDLINFKTMSVDFGAWLWFCVDGLGVKPANAIVAGGTGSGKTTTLNTLAAFIPGRDRVITIEDTLELQLKPHEHWVRMETRPPNVEGKGEVTMDELVKNTLRMRPDRIILGEVRGPEASTLFTAMNTGHDGCMGTVHANTARETITRITNPPMNVPLIMVPALDLIIMQNKFKHPERGTLRRITEVAEVGGIEEKVVQLNKIFEYDPKTDMLVETGTPSKLVKEIGERAALSGQEVNMEITKRTVVLKWMQDQKMRSLEDVKRGILEFNKDPDGFIDRVTEGM